MCFFFHFAILTAEDMSGFINLPQKNIVGAYPPNKTFHDYLHCRTAVWNSDQPHLHTVFSVFLNGSLNQDCQSTSMGKDAGYVGSDLPRKAKETHQNEHLFKEWRDHGSFTGPSQHRASRFVMWHQACMTWLVKIIKLDCVSRTTSKEWLNGFSQDWINGALKMAYDYVKQSCLGNGRISWR